MDRAADETILHFWFEEISPEQWWRKDAAFDQMIRARFADLHAAVARCEHAAWRATARGRLAEVLVLDQFSRNLYRDDARAFACDPLALALAQEAIAAGHDLSLPPLQRAFFYMPFMHSESKRIHEEAVKLFSQAGMSESQLQFELRHKAIIDRFGRYPHRNAALGRESTAQERAFLSEPGSSF